MSDTAPIGHTAAKSPPAKTSLAGGAHYHAVAATRAWRTYVQSVQADARQSQAQREAKQRTEQHDTAYREAHPQTTQGGK